MNTPTMVLVEGYGTSSGQVDTYHVWRLTRTAVWLRHVAWGPTQVPNGERYSLKTGRKPKAGRWSVYSGQEIRADHLEQLRQCAALIGEGK